MRGTGSYGKRFLPIVASASLALLAAAPAARGAAAGEGRPNILFLMADQCRADFLGAEAGPAARTPNLDRLAAEGIRFRCAYPRGEVGVPLKTSGPASAPGQGGIA